MSDLMDELLAIFRSEASEHLDLLNNNLLVLERGSFENEAERKENIQESFRSAHSLKGAARAVTLIEIEQISHRLESIFQQIRDAGLVLDADSFDVMYDALDTIQQLLQDNDVDITDLQMRLANLIESEPLPSKGVPQLISAEDNQQVALSTLRVDLSKLDNLMTEVGELLVAQMRSDQRQRDFRHLRSLTDDWLQQWHDLELLINQNDHNIQLKEQLRQQSKQTQTLINAMRDLEHDVRLDHSQLSLIASNLQDRVRQIRMIPFNSILLMLRRLVRDVAHSENKQVELIVRGEQVEVDKRVLEIIKDPLIQLLRNAIVHGIEPEAERLEQSKTPYGTIHLVVEQRGGEVYIKIKDDGRGFDLDKLKNAYTAQTSGKINDAQSEMNIVDLAFLPGVSTLDTVTELAGRGMGLDIVREQVKFIQGRVSVDTEIGNGSQINLMLPSSLLMTRVLIVCSAGQQFALPLQSIDRITSLDDVLTLADKPILRVNGESIRLVTLSALLAITEDKKLDSKSLAVIIQVAEQRVALVVDDVITELELAVKPLQAPLRRVRNIMGAALMGNGRPILVLNLSDLIESIQDAIMPNIFQHDDQDSEEPIVCVLVVDDSITTRMLEKNILESAGYQVITAIDGQEALKRLQDHRIDIVVSDVQMPNLDGFQLTRQLRDDEKTKHLPIVLVTSLEKRAEREEGLLAGADAYIVKRGFDQAELLETIQRLL